MSRPESFLNEPSEPAIVFSTDVLGLIGPLLVVLPVQERVVWKIMEMIFQQYYPGFHSTGGQIIEWIKWHRPDFFPDLVSTTTTHAHHVHGRLGTKSGAPYFPYDFLMDPTIRSIQESPDLLIHVGEAKSVSRGLKNQHSSATLGILDAISVALELKEKKYNVGVVIDLAHLIRENNNSKIPNTQLGVGEMLKTLETTLVILAGKNLSFAIHLPIGTKLQDSLPPVFWENENNLITLASMLKDHPPKWITIENQGRELIPTRSHIKSTHERMQLLKEFGIIQPLQS